MRKISMMILVIFVLLLTVQSTFAEWTQRCFVDDFGDKTDDKYIEFKTEGIFSNSATSNSRCRVNVIVSNTGGIGIFLYEYGSNPPVYFKDGHFMMKNSKGDLFEEYSISRWSQRGGISLGVNYDFMLFLKISIGEIKVAIYDRYSSYYYFKINANGFLKALTNLNQNLLIGITNLETERLNTLAESRELRDKLEAQEKRKKELESIICEKYIVKEGDTLRKVAKNYGISFELLKEINHYVGTPVIRIGQELLIPKKYHIVRSGDSPYGIAQKYGISVTELRRLNNLSKKQLVYPGQKLLILKDSGQ